MSKALLIDLTRCIGCRGCQVACKQWNELPAETTHNTGSYQNPPRLSANSYTVVTFNEVEQNGRLEWVFAKRQCMHCQHPACASACTVGALRKTSTGPVVYDSAKCIGCRYCQYACPFNVPSFQWQSTFGLIGKCTMCADRQGEGQEPACVKTCPTNAIEIGERIDLLAEARRRIITNVGDYVNHIYGEHEVGGASVLYLSGIPFDKLGFPTLGREPITENAEAVMRMTPFTATAVAAISAGLYWIIKRRDQMMQETLAKQLLAMPAAAEEEMEK